jgi:hypothetical protein
VSLQGMYFVGRLVGCFVRNDYCRSSVCLVFV